MSFNWLEIEGIDGWLYQDEATLLYELALSAPAGTLWCEIGSWKGRSTVALAQSGRPGIAIDWFRGSPEHDSSTNTYGEFMLNTAKYREFISVFPATSYNVELPTDTKIGVLFLDGEHSYQAVRHDFNKFKQFVVPGGYVVFHDALWSERYAPNPWPDVTRFVDELVARGHKIVKSAGRCAVIQI